MLFFIKQSCAASLASAVVLALVANMAASDLGLAWSFQIERCLWAAPVSLGILLMSDGLVDGLLRMVAGDGYRRRFARFAAYFAGQTWPAIIAGGVLAASEELVFRGVALDYVRSRAGLGSGWAVLFSALLFGACHWIPRRELWPFAIWAVWEGIVIGGLYVATDSLAAIMLAHCLHDILGFVILRHSRASRIEGSQAGIG